MPAKAKKSLAEEVKTLKAENAKLKKQISNKTTPAIDEPESSGIGRIIAIILVSGLAGAILVVANLVFWTARTIVETDRYSSTMERVIEKPAVQIAIADKATEELFKKVDTEKLLIEALPPRADFAVPTLAKQIESTTNEQARKVVASEQFKGVWVDANRNAHDRLITGIKNYQGDGTIDISDVFNRLTDRLKDTKLSFLQDVQLPEKIGSIQLIETPRLKQAHDVVVNLDKIRLATIIGFLALTEVVVLIARDRRKIIARLGIVYASLMFATLVAVRVAREITVNNVDPKYQQAALETWQALFSPFVLQTAGLLVLALAMASIAWIVGPGKTAGKVKGSFNKLFEGKIHSAIFSKENSFTKWVGKYRVKLQSISVAVAFLSLLVISVTAMNVLWVLLGLIIAVAVIQVCSSSK